MFISRSLVWKNKVLKSLKKKSKMIGSRLILDRWKWRADCSAEIDRYAPILPKPGIQAGIYSCKWCANPMSNQPGKYEPQRCIALAESMPAVEAMENFRISSRFGCSQNQDLDGPRTHSIADSFAGRQFYFDRLSAEIWKRKINIL